MEMAATIGANIRIDVKKQYKQEKAAQRREFYFIARPSMTCLWQ